MFELWISVQVYCFEIDTTELKKYKKKRIENRRKELIDMSVLIYLEWLYVCLCRTNYYDDKKIVIGRFWHPQKQWIVD